MRWTLVLFLACVMFILPLSGCFVRTGPGHGHRHGQARSGRGCHPSQYWDGRQCRHKGKGHGARKHDGR